MSSPGAFVKVAPDVDLGSSVLALARRIAVPQTAILFAVLVLVAVLLQRAAGGERAGFGGAADEAAHYVTALMIRDYVADGMPASPVAYAERYYLDRKS